MKKQYIFPQTEVLTMVGACNLMKTSIDPAPDPSSAPKRRVEVF
jgi:hypothetical protein